MRKLSENMKELKDIKQKKHKIWKLQEYQYQVK